MERKWKWKKSPGKREAAIASPVVVGMVWGVRKGNGGRGDEEQEVHRADGKREQGREERGGKGRKAKGADKENKTRKNKRCQEGTCEQGGGERKKRRTEAKKKAKMRIRWGEPKRGIERGGGKRTRNGDRRERKVRVRRKRATTPRLLRKQI
eukprot:TRINITY_DN67423_c0_g1_i1.p3 TRINITY_DN67423_c0_g1~~TRINITY_DN67423_c0_g1_i1.p3  ORF type:complete len:152 (+),score=18.03 TRINITY_DN67423_c0_g1_i1:378-833(+)